MFLFNCLIYFSCHLFICLFIIIIITYVEMNNFNGKLIQGISCLQIFSNNFGYNNIVYIDKEILKIYTTHKWKRQI